jgi:hypothetical protein
MRKGFTLGDEVAMVSLYAWMAWVCDLSEIQGIEGGKISYVNMKVRYTKHAVY